jgi:hypothetical protein
MSKNLLDKYSLDDDTKFWIELDEIIELYPIRDYNLESEPLKRYQNVVSMDLDTRVLAMKELFKFSGSNYNYLVDLSNKLKEKCINDDRYDLCLTLDFAMQEAREKREKMKKP